MKKLLYMVLLSLLISFISCSEKSDLLEESKSYGRVYFVNNSIFNVNLGIKYMGEPYNDIAFVGPGTFTFYNKRTGEVLLEKELEVKANDTEPWYIFQPDSTIAPQLIRNTQVDEPAAPEGYFKIKIANLSKIALTNDAGIPYPIVDIIIHSTLVSTLKYVPFDTITGIGNNLDTASYYLIKKAIRTGTGAIQTNYRFSFLDHTTKSPILNSGGTLYTTSTFSATLTGKNVYTVYLSDYEDNPNSAWILKNDKYYRVLVNSLFE